MEFIFILEDRTSRPSFSMRRTFSDSVGKIPVLTSLPAVCEKTVEMDLECLLSSKKEAKREKKLVQNRIEEVPRIDQKATAYRIRYYMQRAGLKPIDIQQYLSLTCVQTVYRWLDGTNIPSIDHLYALSFLFCVPIDDMIAGVCGESERQLGEETVRRMRSYWECCARLFPVTRKMFEKKKLPY